MAKPNNYKELSQKRIVSLIDEFCGDEQDRKQQAFADMCGISKYSVSQYVNGTNSPGNVSAAKIGHVCNVNPLWVMGLEDDRMSDADRFARSAETYNTSHASLPTLQEKMLLDNFRMLNTSNQKSVIKYAQALVDVQNAEYALKAAHHRTDSQDDHDSRIMSEDDEWGDK